MGFETKENERKQKPLPPEGQTLGLCYSIIDMGTQITSYPGKPPGEAKQVQLSWELPKYRAVFNQEVGEQVMALFQTYTFSLSEKANFRKMIDSWVGKPVKALSDETMQKFLGKPCMIQIVHATSKDGKLKYANIAMKGLGIYKRPAEVPFPENTENEKIFFSLSSFSWDTYNKIPKFMQETIAKSKEWPGILRNYPNTTQSTSSMEVDEASRVVTSNVEEEDIPF